MGRIACKRKTVTYTGTHMQVSKVNLPVSQVEAIAQSPNVLRIFPYKTPHCYPSLTSPPQFGGKANQDLPDKTISTHTHAKRLLGTPPFHTVS